MGGVSDIYGYLKFRKSNLLHDFILAGDSEDTDGEDNSLKPYVYLNVLYTGSASLFDIDRLVPVIHFVTCTSS